MGWGRGGRGGCSKLAAVPSWTRCPRDDFQCYRPCCRWVLITAPRRPRSRNRGGRGGAAAGDGGGARGRATSQGRGGSRCARYSCPDGGRSPFCDGGGGGCMTVAVAPPSSGCRVLPWRRGCVGRRSSDGVPAGVEDPGIHRLVPPRRRRDRPRASPKWRVTRSEAFRPGRAPLDRVTGPGDELAAPLASGRCPRSSHESPYRAARLGRSVRVAAHATPPGDREAPLSRDAPLQFGRDVPRAKVFLSGLHAVFVW